VPGAPPLDLQSFTSIGYSKRHRPATAPGRGIKSLPFTTFKGRIGLIRPCSWGEDALAKSSRKAKNGNGPLAVDQKNVVIEYIKSQLFRVVHADGAVGGVTPSGNLHIAFFSERPAIPRMMVHRRNENGTLGDLLPEQTVVRPGMIREMDVDIMIQPHAVGSLIKWLQERQVELEKFQDRAKDIAQDEKKTGRRKSK
jgi:hypothetical protein